MARKNHIHDFDTWVAARQAANDLAGISSRMPIQQFFERPIWARVPARWANCRIFGGAKKGPRDLRVPRARYWPGGVYPAGMAIAQDPATDAQEAA